MKKLTMKKLLTAAIVLFFALSPNIVFSAGTIDCTTTDEKRIRTVSGKTWVEITCALTADASDGSFPDTAIPFDVVGYYLYMVAYYYGAVTPITDDSDLTLTQGSTTGYDILYGAGTDKIDIATNNQFQPQIGGSDAVMPIYDTLYIQIDNNSVNSATGVLIFKFIE